ncbi:MAG TPA: extracellular solute-binding protein [Verrucomicrobiae bacterium]|nr:extracellular solute-binding protein [Verrucomicrobiae bacterium]
MPGERGMMGGGGGRRRWSGVVVALAAASGAALLPIAPVAARASRSGTADVAYAASLALVNDTQVGPAFTRASGYAYQGRAGESDALVQEIRSGEIAPNVLMTVGGAPIATVEPRFTRWYVELAASPIVIAYNPRSRYAAALGAIARGAQPIAQLFRLLARPGFLLGRTDPETDPQGQAFVLMLELAQQRFHLPPGTSVADLGGRHPQAQIFAEASLEARLQAGQLDAASAFRSQAVQLHLPFITLPAAIDFGNPADAVLYHRASLRLADGTVVRGAPLVIDITVLRGRDQAAAVGFVRYVLSGPGRALYRRAGYTLLPERIVGDRAAAPAAVRAVAGG